MGQDPALKEFGQVVKEIRLSKGLTQLEVADRFKSAESTMSKLESGQFNPSLLWILKLAKALEVKPAELIGRLREIE